MEDYNRSDRYRNDSRTSSHERNDDMNWDSHYNTGDDYRGYDIGNRNVYSSDREREYWRGRNNRMNGRYPNDNKDYGGSFDRGYEDYRNQRYNNYNRNYPNDSNRNNYMDNNRSDGMNDNYMGRSNDYFSRYNRNNDRYDNNNFNNGNRNESNNNYRNNDRDWWDKTRDEVASWFGDDDAERRRHRDEMRDGEHRGKGPKNYTRTEERIKEDVSDHLTNDSFLDASGIEVNVNDGEVTLNGHVDSRYSKHRAEDITEDITGVKHVQNNLRVKEDTDNTIDKASVNNSNKTITSNTSYNTTKNKKENTNA